MPYVLFSTTFGTCGLAWNDAGLTGFQLPEQTEMLTQRRLAGYVPKRACWRSKVQNCYPNSPRLPLGRDRPLVPEPGPRGVIERDTRQKSQTCRFRGSLQFP